MKLTSTANVLNYTKFRIAAWLSNGRIFEAEPCWRSRGKQTYLRISGRFSIKNGDQAARNVHRDFVAGRAINTQIISVLPLLRCLSVDRLSSRRYVAFQRTVSWCVPTRVWRKQTWHRRIFERISPRLYAYIGCYTPTSRPTCVHASVDALPPLKYAPCCG